MADEKDKTPDREDRHEYIPGVQEKSTIGGKYNTGVTSDDPAEKDEIEKKGTMANIKSKEQKARDEEDRNADQQREK